MRRIAIFAALVLLLASFGAARTALATSFSHGTAEIESVLQDPQIIRYVAAWGLSMADIRHDVSTMSPAQRQQLANVLSRKWRGSRSSPAAAMQAQFLVMMSLMRESTLFASILSSGSSRSLR